MKMSVIYHSVTGNTKNMGEKIVEGMKQVSGVEAKAFSIDNLDEEFVKESRCVVFGSPIYMAHITGQMMNFMIQKTGALQLAGKLCGAYTTAQYAHGGAELGIQEMLNHMMVMGGMVYSGGGSFGKPIIHLGPVGIDNTMDIEQFVDYFVTYGTRMATKAVELWSE
ncbi:MAG: flavodoxin domain-containing protein [Lachnospiraceae bacterium]|nr:flavodoxin domain-containing protein [Lachnospiraceae bacterium]